jgi:bifunctional N-acetylglucosamine-1-phosphate-uridyltransferase/glucosamine-1-phosphate-acetyltransferase GlmU-like protein
LLNNLNNIDNIPAGKIDPNKWTAIIPAAGLGSRLGYTSVKILYPIMGKTILEWIIIATEKICSKYIFILSPSGQIQVEPHLKKIIPFRYEIVIQIEPSGMGDAILLSEVKVKTDYSLVMWGDQATAKEETLRKCAYSHISKIDVSLTIPTLIKKDPYINLIRNQEGLITAVQQKRESEIPVGVYGENDCGFFLFTNKYLFQMLKKEKVNLTNYGKETKEFNLLPTLPGFELCGSGINTVRITDVGETIGINTLEDAVMAESVLKKRRL